MIIMTLYGLVTLALIIAFIWLCVWSYSPKRRERFKHDANIPFMDEISSDKKRGGK